MATLTTRDRLLKLEKQRRFLNWFAQARFFDSLTDDELGTYACTGKLPAPVPYRPSRMDQMDRNSLLKLWEEQEQQFAGRSLEEVEHFGKHGFWPEQKNRVEYWSQDGNLFVAWGVGSEEETGSKRRQKH
jgi:hypothetical protein